jgi:hypothetical protein
LISEAWSGGNGIAFSDEGRYSANIGRVSAGEEQGSLSAFVRRDPLLQLFVKRVISRNRSRCCRDVAVCPQSINNRSRDARVARQTQIVV